jgi:hypothetical protein
MARVELTTNSVGRTIPTKTREALVALGWTPPDPDGPSECVTPGA